MCLIRGKAPDRRTRGGGDFRAEFLAGDPQSKRRAELAVVEALLPDRHAPPFAAGIRIDGGKKLIGALGDALEMRRCGRLIRPCLRLAHQQRVGDDVHLQLPRGIAADHPELGGCESQSFRHGGFKSQQVRKRVAPPPRDGSLHAAHDISANLIPDFSGGAGLAITSQLAPVGCVGSLAHHFVDRLIGPCSQQFYCTARAELMRDGEVARIGCQPSPLQNGRVFLGQQFDCPQSQGAI